MPTLETGSTISTNQSKFGNNSLRTQGSGGGLSNAVLLTSSDLDHNWTVEFQFYYTSAGSGAYLFKQGDHYFKLKSNGGWEYSWGSGSYTQGGSLTTNTWHHIVFAFPDNSPNTDRITVFRNGERLLALIPTNAPTFPTPSDNKVYFNQGLGGTYDGYMDEIRISTTDRYGFVSTITEPTAPFTYDNDTRFLIHFEDGTNLDTGQIQGEADLSASFSASSTATRTRTSSLDVSASFTKRTEGSIKGEQYFETGYIAFDYFEGEPIVKEGDADLSASVTMSAVSSAEFVSGSVISSSIVQQTEVDRIRDGNTDLSGSFTTDATASKTAETSSDLSVQMSANTVPSRTAVTSVELEAFNNFSVTANAKKNTNSDIRADFTITADPERTAVSAVTLETIVNLSLQGDRTRSADSAMSAQSTLDAQSLRLKSLSADLSTQAALTAITGNIQQGAADLSANFTTVSSAERIRTDTSALSVSFDVVLGNPTRTRTTSSDLDSAIDLQAAPGKITQGGADLTAFNTQVVIANKQGEVLVTLDNTNFTISIDADKIRDAESDLNVQATVTAEPEKLAETNVDLSAQFAITAQEEVTRRTSADLDTALDITAEPRTIKRASIDINGAMSFASTAQATRNEEIDFVADFTLDTTAERTARVVQNLSAASSIVTARGGILREAEVALSSNFTTTSAIRKQVIDVIVYDIPSETRNFTVEQESRSFTIHTENRAYTIQGEE